MELHITTQVLWAGFAVALVMGAFVNKTNFCTMGAVSDMVNMGDTGRFRAWIFAIALAIIGVIVMESMGLVDLSTMRPPYRSANFDWSRYILGGIMFGVGMTLASGCGNKTLIRIGGGNIKSVVVLIVAGYFAYLMTKTDFYGVVFYSWMNPISIELSMYDISGQDLGALLGAVTGAEDPAQVRLVVGGVIALGMLVYALKSADFRASIDNVMGGAIVGIAVIVGWYVTGGPLGQELLSEADMMNQRPLGIGAQSYSFTNPMGETFDLAMNPTNKLLITFGVMGLFGVIAGSFLYALLFRKFRFEWFSSWSDLINHLVGAVLMGIGGILAMGCTIGQGVTGFSSLALGSIMAFLSIIFGSALTMKVQFYKMVYEGEASFFSALITALVDMRMLPGGMRKLEAV